MEVYHNYHDIVPLGRYMTYIAGESIEEEEGGGGG